VKWQKFGMKIKSLCMTPTDQPFFNGEIKNNFFEKEVMFEGF
jgi:hypothetical protein